MGSPSCSYNRSQVRPEQLVLNPTSDSSWRTTMGSSVGQESGNRVPPARLLPPGEPPAFYGVWTYNRLLPGSNPNHRKMNRAFLMIRRPPSSSLLPYPTLV